MCRCWIRLWYGALADTGISDTFIFFFFEWLSDTFITHSFQWPEILLRFAIWDSADIMLSAAFFLVRFLITTLVCITTNLFFHTFRLSNNLQFSDCAAAIFYSLMKLALEAPYNTNGKSSFQYCNSLLSGMRNICLVKWNVFSLFWVMTSILSCY